MRGVWWDSCPSTPRPLTQPCRRAHLCAARPAKLTLQAGPSSASNVAPPAAPLPPVWGDMVPRAKFGGERGTPLTVQSPGPPPAPPPSPLRYTPGDSAEQSLTSKTALEGERRQVTVLLADPKGSMAVLYSTRPSRRLFSVTLWRVWAVPQGRGCLGTSDIVKSITASALLYGALTLVAYTSESLAETIGYQDSPLRLDIAS
jgi:hypothetical protein